MKKCFGTYMAQYLSDYLSLPFKIYLTSCVAYMPTTKKMISQLVQQTLVVEDPYQKITLISLVYHVVSINFIDTWLYFLVKKIALSCCAYQDQMKEISKRIPTEIQKPTPEDLRKNIIHCWLILGVDVTWTTCATIKFLWRIWS